MTTILLIVHLLIALALVGVILLQRSEGGALGIGGGGVGGLMTGRSSANLLTRATAIPGGGLHHDQPAPGDRLHSPERAALDPRSAGRARTRNHRRRRPRRRRPSRSEPHSPGDIRPARHRRDCAHAGFPR